MQTKRRFLLSSTALIAGASFPLSACSQTSQNYRQDLYACQGCDATAEVKPDNLPSTVQITNDDEPGERLILRGTVLSSDGTKPVGGVVIYLHQTNIEGVYEGGDESNPNSLRHGRLRGWAKSAGDGSYEFHTIKPAPYPQHIEPAHIHLYIQEPNRPPYYIDNVVFEGEYLVDEAFLAKRPNRGGSGLVKLKKNSENELIAIRNIILERHPPK